MMKLKKILLIFFIINLSILYSNNNQKNISDWEKVYYQISNEQKYKLEKCARYLFKNNMLGYVLFGNKPIYLAGFFDPLTSHHTIFSPNIKETVMTRIMIDILEDLNLIGNNPNNNFIIQTQYKKFHDKFSYVLFINKQAFIKTVNQHLLLFQYVLGPNVTAEKLLEKVASPNETIFSALNNDVTLVGIVLGYGGYNGCFDSFISRIDKFLESNNENLPLISRKIIYAKKYQDKSKFFHKYNEKFTTKSIFPSFGYLSLKEEYNDLVKRCIISKTLSDQTNPNFPYFGCELTEETKTIIKEYKEIQKDLQKILSSKNFLEKVFARFAGKDRLKGEKNFQKKTPCYYRKDRKDKKDYSDLLSQMFLKSFEKYFNNDKTFIQAFIDGLKMKEIKDIKICDHIINEKKLSKKIKAKKNLEFSNIFFEKLEKKNNLTHIVDKKLSYMTLQKGQGNAILDANNVVSVFYKLSTIDGKPFEIDNAIGVKIKEPLVNFIPGIAKALINMKKNERRKVFIHPSYGYAEKTTLNPNLGLIAEIELIDFEKDENIKDTSIKPHILKAEKYDLDKLENKKRQHIIFNGNILGRKNSEYIRKKSRYFSLEKIINNLENPSKNKVDLENDNIQKEIRNLYWMLYD